MMIARERTEPHVSIVNGTTEDLLQRYTLRVMVYEANRAAFNAVEEWAGRSPPRPFAEDPTHTGIRDFSTVEELNLALQLQHFIQLCCEIRPKLTQKQISQRIDVFAKGERAAFIARYGYKPEESTVPRIPVTSEGPVDPEAYRQRLKQQPE